MKTKAFLAAVSALAIAGTAQPASLVLDFQNTVASEEFDAQDGTYGATNPARFLHVSVNANNPGYGSYIALDPSNNVIAPYTRTFSDPIVGWAFYGGGDNNVLQFSEESGGLISFTTTDTAFDSFGQNQIKFWNATDPGANIGLPADAAGVGTTTHDKNVTGHRALNQVSSSIDISGLASGTANIIYADFNGTPSINVVMKDTDGGAPDIVLGDVHSVGVGGNGDFANRAEYYAAEVSFVTDGVYDVIEYDLSMSNSGRGGGVVLTGVVPEPGSLALLGLGGLLIARRRRG